MTDPDRLLAEIIYLTQILVQRPSLPGEEAEVAHQVRSTLKSQDWDEVWVDELGSVIATRQGQAPGPRILFDAHMDVVPVQNAASWSSDPFSGELRDGKLWGRGATDIKGGLAAMILALGRLPRSQFHGTLILSASVGEEQIEGLALRPVLARTRPDFAVIVEPTECKLGTGQKGRTEFWIDVVGKAAHTSQPELGENAILRAAEMALELKKLSMPLDPMLGRGVMTLVEIASRPMPGECTVPFGCRMRYDRRLVSRETRESVLSSIKNALSPFSGWTAGFQTGSLSTYTGQKLAHEHFYPGWTLAANSPWLAKARRGLELGGLPVETMTAPYCTHASYTAGEAGVPSILFGPSSISQAHIVDEWVEPIQLLKAHQGFAGLATALSAF